jgi:hypothetical protein
MGNYNNNVAKISSLVINCQSRHFEVYATCHFYATYIDSSSSLNKMIDLGFEHFQRDIWFTTHQLFGRIMVQYFAIGSYRGYKIGMLIDTIYVSFFESNIVDILFT